MFSNAESVECRVSANILLAAAHRLFSYNKAPFALMLVQIVLEQHPEHAHALRLRDLFASDSSADSNRMFHLYYDAQAGVYYVSDRNETSVISFPTLEEAERYLRNLK